MGPGVFGLIFVKSSGFVSEGNIENLHINGKGFNTIKPQ